MQILMIMYELHSEPEALCYQGRHALHHHLSDGQTGQQSDNISHHSENRRPQEAEDGECKQGSVITP